MCAIVKDDQIIFITRYTDNRRCLKVAMYKIKLIRRMEGRHMKGQASMAP
jgi:hypothetical protein